MSVYEYRTIRIERGRWPDLARELRAGVVPAVREPTGLVIGLFGGLIGFASDEGVVLTAWPSDERLVSGASSLIAGRGTIVEFTAERIAASVRPQDATPITPGLPADVYAHRWFWLQPQDWAEFVTLSETGVWPYFESDGCRIIGLWRSMEAGPLAKALLMTRYPSVAHWERTRLQSPDPPPAADERLYRAAQDAARQRARLTERSIVRITRLIPVTDP